jgi:hypothetical protein
VPADNLLAFKENERKIQCEIFVNNNKTEHACYLHLNVQFKPFVDKTVSRFQILDRSRVIQCPIRAPNFPAYKYLILWSKFVNNKRIPYWFGNFTLTSASLQIEQTLETEFYSCALFENNLLLFEINITSQFERKANAELQIKVEHSSLNGLWSITVLIPVAGLFAALKLRENRRTRRGRASSRPRAVSSMPLLTISEQTRLRASSSLPLLTIPEQEELRFIDCMPVPTFSQPPVYEDICETNLCSHDFPERFGHCSSRSPTPNSMYRIPVMCMTSMASMCPNETVVAPLGSPSSLARLQERILMLRDQVSDEDEKAKLFATAAKTAARKQPDYPSFI